MKRFFSLLLVLAASFLGQAQLAAQNCTLKIFAGDFTSRPQSVRSFALWPVPNLVPATNNLGIITGDFVSGLTDTNGTATLTNVIAGTYRMEFRGTTVTSTNYLLIPATTNTISARDWVTLYPTGLGFLLYEEAGVVGGRLIFEP